MYLTKDIVGFRIIPIDDCKILFYIICGVVLNNIVWSVSFRKPLKDLSLKPGENYTSIPERNLKMFFWRVSGFYKQEKHQQTSSSLWKDCFCKNTHFLTIKVGEIFFIFY